MQPITLTWPGGEHDFALRIGEIRALQTARNAGPEEIFNRLRLGTWQGDDLTQVIKWGLVGGGMDKAEAATMVTALIDLHPLIQFKLTALAALGHALLGELEDETPGKPEAGESPPANGNSQNSTEPEPS